MGVTGAVQRNEYMKVKELIKILESLDQELVVNIYNNEVDWSEELKYPGFWFDGYYLVIGNK